MALKSPSMSPPDDLHQAERRLMKWRSRPRIADKYTGSSYFTRGCKQRAKYDDFTMHQLCSAAQCPGWGMSWKQSRQHKSMPATSNVHCPIMLASNESGWQNYIECFLPYWSHALTLQGPTKRQLYQRATVNSRVVAESCCFLEFHRGFFCCLLVCSVHKWPCRAAAPRTGMKNKDLRMTIARGL